MLYIMILMLVWVSEVVMLRLMFDVVLVIKVIFFFKFFIGFFFFGGIDRV